MITIFSHLHRVGGGWPPSAFFVGLFSASIRFLPCRAFSNGGVFLHRASTGWTLFGPRCVCGGGLSLEHALVLPFFRHASTFAKSWKHAALTSPFSNNPNSKAKFDNTLPFPPNLGSWVEGGFIQTDRLQV